MMFSREHPKNAMSGLQLNIETGQNEAERSSRQAMESLIAKTPKNRMTI
jgi:hypothetical protein